MLSGPKSIVPEFKRCPVCGKMFIFDPDLGQLGHPACMLLANEGKKKKESLLSKIKSRISRPSS